MPEWIIILFIFYLFYLVMNTSKTSTEKAVAKTKVEKPKAAAVAEVKPKTEKPKAGVVAEAKPKAQKPVKTAATETQPKKPSSAAKSPKQTKTEAPAAKAAADVAVSERVGLTAGSIWNYLNQNGATPVTKLLKELAEEEKIVQRSIGWLAQEGKIILSITEKVETIELK
jgi:hypothetical protein